VVGLDSGKQVKGWKQYSLVDARGLLLAVMGQKRFVLLAHRWVVERTFAWLGCHRRLYKDYERLLKICEAFIHNAMTRFMLLKLACS